MRRKSRRRGGDAVALGPRDWTFETAARVERSRRPRLLRPRPRRRTARSAKTYRAVGVARARPRRGPLVLPSRSQVRGALSRLPGILALTFWLWVAAWVSLSDAYYVAQVEVEGNRFVSTARLVERAGVPQGYHIFFVDPVAVRERLLSLPEVQTAEVQCRLPGRVLVQVVEREPVLTWRAGAGLFWADVEGVLWPAEEPLPGAVTVVEVDRAERQPGERVGADLVQSVRELAALLPDVPEFAYSRAHGLAFRTAEGTQVFLGTQELPYRVQVLRTLLEELKIRGALPAEVHLEYRYPVVRR